MKRAFLRGIAALILALVAAQPAAAQTGQMFGELVGKVTDDQGGVLPGVVVTLSGPAVMGVQSATTNERGQYRFPAVNTGTYKLTFELAGFSPTVRDGIVVPVRSTITVDAQLKLATLQETVTVTGASPVIDTSSTRVQQNFKLEALQEIPNSRDLWSLLALTPA